MYYRVVKSIQFFILFTSILLSQQAFSVIDMKNANFSDIWTDIILPGSGYELRIQRTYNSRTIYSGLFGFGWCSDYETLLEVTTENQLRLTECGAGMVIDYNLKNYNPKKVQKTIATILKEVKKRNPSMSKKKLASLKNDLITKKPLRIALAKRLKMSGDIKEGRIYRANGREADMIVYKGNAYVRTLANGTKQKFNTKGQLIAMYDSNSNYLKIDYNKSKIKSVVDNNGRKLSFHYYKKGPQRNRLHYITGPKKIISKYKFDGDNLVENINQWGSKYTYKYDRLHNLTRINFPDKTFKALSYNQKRDWVTSFTHRDKCKETYDYKVNKKNKAGHYWSTVKKVCGKEVTNNSKYEFVYKFKKASKNKFLYKVNSKINGNETKITYHEVFGKPTFINRNGFLTKYNYFKNGFVKTKKENYRHFEFSYDKTCNKVSAMKTKYFIDKKTKKKAKKQKKLFKLVKSLYKYKTPKCNLVYAKDSSGQTVNISYDRTGRIKKITDQSKKIVHLKYDKKYGKPSYIARPGLGSINISYNKNGEIKDVKSKDGPQVATQVATVFNVLLELISPATAELTL